MKKQTFLKSTLLFPQMIQFCSFLFYTYVIFFLKQQTIFFTSECGFSQNCLRADVSYFLIGDVCTQAIREAM